MKFIKGQKYYAVKPLGVKKRDDGQLQLSQKLNNDSDNVRLNEEFTFYGRENGKLWFIRKNGMRVYGHSSHFDPNDKYNVSKSGTQKDLSLDKKRTQAELPAAFNDFVDIDSE